MLLNTQQILTHARLHLTDTKGIQQGNRWQDSDLLVYLHQEERGLIAKVVEVLQDWYLTVKNIDFVANQSSYPLFNGFLTLRLVEFQVDSDSSNPQGEFQQAIESRMEEGVSGAGGISAQTESQFYYALDDQNIDFLPIPGSSVSGAGRMWFIREPGPPILEIPSSVPNGSTIVLSSGLAPPEDDIMINSQIDIVAGTGAGQRNTITSWTGATKTAGLATPFSPVPDNTSMIASISRVPRLFHDLLSMGTALRAKADVNENLAAITSLYNDRMEDFLDFIERRTGAQVSVAPFDPDDGI